MSWMLAVDDDADVRGSVAELLRCEGYEVVEAESGQRALHLLLTRRDRPDLILLDLMMPGMQGEALIEVLRELGMLHELAIVVLTAAGAGNVPGARRVLHKPCSLDELLTVAGEFCEPTTRDDLEPLPSR